MGTYFRFTALFIALAALGMFGFVNDSAAKSVQGSIKGVVRATTGASNTHPVPLPNARLTLINRDRTNQVYKILSDDSGAFVFHNLPGANYVLTAEADGLPSVTREISLSDGASLTIEIELTASLSESVTVREEEGLLSTGRTTTSNTVLEQTLKNLPLRAENYESALPLTPGVVRDTNGEDHLKGARAGQSAYTVNGADVTDPVAGKLAFDIPLEAAASVQVEENPYLAEFGKLTGGSTNVETKGGSNDFRIRAARFFPTFRYVLSGPLDSFRPRVTFSGPVIRDRLFFLQSFEYRFTRVRVPGLPSPHNDFTSVAFNSFSQLDLNINKNNRVKFVLAVFPQTTHHVGLNTFNSQETVPDIKQRGALVSISEQLIFDDSSFLSSAFSYKTYDVDVLPKGSEPLNLFPDQNTGNYFAETRRNTRRFQMQETYFAHPLTQFGQHSLKLGAEFDRTHAGGRFHNNSILIRRNDGTLAQSINFTGTGSTAFHVSELSAFVEDHWTVSPRVVIDAGLRLDRDGIVQNAKLAPRLSFMLVPRKNSRTIIRGGIGLFYDRIPLSVGYFDRVPLQLDSDEGQPLETSTTFTQYPQRIVTTFAPDGETVVDGPRLFRNDAEEPLDNLRSVRWSLQVDRKFTKDLTLRIGFLNRATSNELLIEPHTNVLNLSTLDLSHSGRSHYRELQLIAIYNNSRLGHWDSSYVWSTAQGDLNTADNFIGDLPSFVVRPNEYGPLAFDVRHRFLLNGELKLPADILFAPAVEIHSGFPFSIVDEQLNFVGDRNRAGHFPTFISFDVQLTKGLRIPRFEKHKVRVGAAIFNITNHFNPRDVQNNLGSASFGQFYNSLGTSVRGKFEVAF